MKQQVQVINLHIPQLDEVNDRLCSIEAQLGDYKTTLDAIQSNQEKIMASLDETLAVVTKEATDVGSIKAFIVGLKQQLADALANVKLSPADQAKVDAIFTQATANSQGIVDALAANVPQAPPAG